MRRAKLLALMISLVLLAGCASGKGWEEKWVEKRDELGAAREISFTARVSADLGETVFDCAMECRRVGGDTEVRITEPELAEGVTVRFESGGASVGYGGTELFLGETEAGVPSPAESAPMIFDALTGGHAVSLWTESAEDGTELLCAQIYAGEDAGVLLWMDAEELAPVYAEIVCAGRAVVRCEIRDFAYQ